MGSAGYNRDEQNDTEAPETQTPSEPETEESDSKEE